jgi:hypothetical protein
MESMVSAANLAQEPGRGVASELLYEYTQSRVSKYRLKTPIV